MSNISGPEGGLPPSVSLVFSVLPDTYSLSTGTTPEICISYISHATRPITIHTFRTLMDKSRTFTCEILDILDLTAQQRIWQPTEKPQVAGIWTRVLGDSWEKYYLTLMPEVPVTLKQPFWMGTHWIRREPNCELTYSPKSRVFKGEEFLRYCQPGHKFRLGIKNGNRNDCPQGISWWRYGLKEEVLEPAGTPSEQARRGWSEPSILFDVQDTEFTIQE